MAIINMFSNKEAEYPEGTYCVLGAEDSGFTKQHPLILGETYVGKCIRDYERNGYDDSDFFMVVWEDAANCPRTIQFATTRFWSYPCMRSYVDASPEIMEKYAVWCEREKRREKILRARKKQTESFKMAKQLNISRRQYLRISNLPEAEVIKPLLKTKNFRSSFRESLAKQVRAWLSQETQTFDRPLSHKQLKAIGYF